MSGKLQIEFDDSEARDIEALATSLDMTPVDVSHFLASLAGKFSEAILRLPTGKRDEFHRSLSRFKDHSIHGASAWNERTEKAVLDLFRFIASQSESDSSGYVDSDIVNDDELSSMSDSLIIRKAELYRRLAR